MFSISSSKAHAGLGGGLLEGVEIYHHHVDGLDAMLGNSRAMSGILAAMQNAAVHFGMERLHSSVQHFGKAGQFGNVLHRDAGVAQQFGGAPGGDQFHSQPGKLAGEVGQAGLVGNAENGPLDFGH